MILLIKIYLWLGHSLYCFLSGVGLKNDAEPTMVERYIAYLPIVIAWPFAIVYYRRTR